MTPAPVSQADHFAGSLDAPATLIEYADFECPFCVRAYPVIEAIRQAFNGDVCFVYRHVPKEINRGFAEQAAEVAEFAASFGKFWPMHARLYTHSGQHDLETLVKFAGEIGLDQAACRQALVEGRFAKHVHDLAAAAVRCGIIGTPTLFVNSTRYEDRMELDLLRTAVSRALDAARTGQRRVTNSSDAVG